MRIEVLEKLPRLNTNIAIRAHAGSFLSGNRDLQELQSRTVSNMEYDSIKDRIGRWLDSRPRILPILFALLDLFFLRTWYVHRALRKINLQSGSKILDAGTGFGQYAWHVARTYPGVYVTATDIKEDYLERARKSFDAYDLLDRIHLIVDDLTDPNVTELFDCILAIDVLEHIEEDDVAIQHFARRMRDGGALIISTPSDQGGSDVRDQDQTSFISEHVRDGYNLDELIQKLINAGLEIVEAKYSYGIFGAIAWRLLIKYPMLLLDRSLFLAPLVVLYYIPVLPLGLLMNLADLSRTNDRGTGLIIVARRNA
ncbi:MAG: class I SAM-dependent methyltransferase [Bacteroidetes bacterium]|nr:class I SAM-dependent methyltransferase [Bacteroidota bacterium]MCY4205095.1 class I SAM-dependent methyltransferase [Bacteroidota bacterium]MCY4279086.1 class I SAM-dependent methyltransferase [Acidimicrobiaceae bacterium]